MIDIKVYKNNFYELLRGNKGNETFIIVLKNGVVFSTNFNYLRLDKYLLETNEWEMAKSSPFPDICRNIEYSNKDNDVYSIFLEDIKFIIRFNNDDWKFLLQKAFYEKFNLSFVETEKELFSLSNVYFIYNHKYIFSNDENKYKIRYYEHIPLSTIPTKEEVMKLGYIVNHLIEALNKGHVFRTKESAEEYLRYLDFLDTVDLDAYLEEFVIRIEKESEDYLRREYQREAIAIAERRKEKRL